MSMQEFKACANRVTRGWGGVAAFALVAPMLGIVVAKMIHPIAGPAQVSAGPSSLTTPQTPRDQGSRTHFFRPVSTDEAAELAAFDATIDSTFERTPLMRLAGEPSAAIARIQIIDDAQPTITPPSVGVTSIMASRGLPIAVVGGKLLRVGDEVSPGWSIGAIDAEAGTVTLLHETGFEHRLNLRP